MPWLRRFYFGRATGGRGRPPRTPATATATTSAASRNWSRTWAPSTPGRSPPSRSATASCCGSAATARTSSAARRREETTSAPTSPTTCAPDELTVEYAEELFAKPSGDFELGTDPASGRQIVAKDGRYGPYVTEVLPEDTPKTGKNAVKPRTASLFKSMSLDTVTLEDALKLMSLPRVVGTDAEGVEITAQNGRYGPYLKKGTDSRSLETEDQLFTITLDEALAIYAQPKQRGRAAAKPPLKELGTDPVSERPVVVKDGRFGAYVTDGETNATLRRDDSVEDDHPGARLRTARREAGQGAGEEEGRRPRRRPAKKAAAKKTAPAKKAAAKKTTAARRRRPRRRLPAKKAPAKKAGRAPVVPSRALTARAGARVRTPFLARRVSRKRGPGVTEVSGRRTCGQGPGCLTLR